MPSTNQEGPGEITHVLRQMRDGSPEALEQLVALTQADLRRIAAARMRGERADHTLQPTALVNEAYIKLVRGETLSFQDRVHFLSVMARIMRQIVVDYARAARAEKRGGGFHIVPTEGKELIGRGRDSDVLALDQALQRLERKDPRTLKVVELRFFGGLTIDETAEVLKVSPRTVKHDWEFGRAWLKKQLSPNRP